MNPLMRSVVKTSFACGVLIAFMSLPSAASDKPWTEIRSPHFRVLTNGNEKDARHIAREFEQMHNVFEFKIRRFRLDTGAPLLVFAAKGQETAGDLNRIFGPPGKPTQVIGLYNQGWEKQFAVVRMDVSEDGNLRGAQNSFNVIYHEYVHSILHMNTRWLPMWLDEGMAEFFGSTHFEGDNVVLGYPSVRIRTLKSHALIPIDVMMKTGSIRTHDVSMDMFYAQAWAMVHYMEFGNGMEGGKKLDQFYGLLDQGVEQEKAFTQVFGPPQKFYEGLNFYLQDLTMKSVVMKDLPKVDDKQFTVRAVSPAESETEIGSYHVWMRDLKDARPLLEQALKDDPKFAPAHENMGFLYFGEGNDEEAAKEFSQAFDLDPKLYLSLYYKAMLAATHSSIPDADDAIYSACLRALQINPQFAEAYVQLALVHVRAGNLNNALLMARKAANLEPGRAGYFLLVAHILQLMGQDEEAGMISSYVATRWNGPDHDEAVEIWNKIPQAHRPPAEGMTDSVPKDTQAVSGKVQSIQCADKDKNIPFELVLDSDGQQMHFHSSGGFATGYSDTVWYGRDHFSLCHHLAGLRAVVRYKAAKDQTYAGDVAEIELRVDMPSPPTKDAAPKQTAAQQQ